MRRKLGMFFAVVVGGCSSGDGPAGPVPLEEAAERAELALCHRLDECFPAFAEALGLGTCEYMAWRFANRSTLDQGEPALGSLEAWVAAGLVRYDASAMGECLVDIANASCATVGRGRISDVGRCALAIAGQVPLGGVCDANLECQSEAYCDLGSDCPNAVCRPRNGAGEPCADDDACGPGLDCAGVMDRRCQPVGHAGDPCRGEFPDCTFGLVCDTSAGTGTCKPLTFTAMLGGACSPHRGELCQRDLTCDQVGTTNEWRCAALHEVGEECQAGGCVAGAVCSVREGSGTCQAPPQPGLDNGEACTPEDRCANGCVDGVCAEARNCSNVL